MTIEELQDKKTNLENHIRDLLQDFQDVTGVNITNLRARATDISVVGSHKTKYLIDKVDIEVVL